jgi:hypothetical protein
MAHTTAPTWLNGGHPILTRDLRDRVRAAITASTTTSAQYDQLTWELHEANAAADTASAAALGPDDDSPPGTDTGWQRRMKLYETLRDARDAVTTARHALTDWAATLPELTTETTTEKTAP